MKRLVIIDGMSVFYRGYFAMPGLSLPNGTPVGGVFGFASIAIEVIKKLEPDYVAVAWDIRGTSTTKRTAIYPEYKAGRTKPPEDFYPQMPILHDLLESFGWPLYELNEYEADDIMGTFSVAAEKKGIETCIVTGDYDMLQLISSHTSVYITKKGSELVHYNSQSFRDKYGVDVAQFVDYKALVGDSSDNIPGVRGVGPKAAEKLLGEYETLDGIYQHVDELKGALKAKVETSKDNAYLSRTLAGIFCDAPIELDWHDANVDSTDLEAVAAKLRELEFHSLIRRLPKHMQQAADTQLYFHEADEVNLTEIAWSKQPVINGPVLLQLVDDELWVSFNDREVTHRKVADIDASFWQAIEPGIVVGYDIKQLYHDLAAHDIFPHFATIHDIRQAAFLIDPLRRDRSLNGLIGGKLGSTIEEIAAMWQIYGWQIEAFAANEALAGVAHRFDFPLIEVLFGMEHRGIAIDPEVLEKMSHELGERHTKLEQKMYALAGEEFNIGSPSQLAEVLFTKLALPTTGIKKGKNSYSTDQKTLDKLRGQHEIIELITLTRELAKLKNTYVDTLPKLADTANRIHTTFNQDVAATGRLSSTRPNLQNIPIRTELGRKIRTAFVPAEGTVLVSADYSQFELRLAAVLAGDQKMINDFNNGIDIHAKTAADVHGIALDEVTKAQRRDAKVVNFGVLYGMGPHALAGNTGMGFAEAKAFIDEYFKVRKPIKDYIDATIKQAREAGFVETFYGRRRPTPDVKSNNFIVRQAAERAAANMPIQGTEADLMKKAMLEVEKRLGTSDGAKAESQTAPLGWQVLQIHDSILIECPEENAEKVSQMLVQVMESVAPELDITLQVDVSVGKDWSEI